MVIEEWMKETHCVSYSTKIDSHMLQCLTNEKSSHYLLDNLMCKSMVYLVIEEWLCRHTVWDSFLKQIQHCCSSPPVKKHTLCVRYFTVLNMGNVCHWCALSRHTVLGIPQIFIHICCTIWPLKNQRLFER